MSGTKAAFTVHNLFSLATRERCLSNLKKLRVPHHWKADAVQPSPNAAVLVPFCSVNNVPSLLYTIRAPNLRTHSGQISFPGGKLEEGESPLQAALRETQEEVGLSPTKVDVWGYGPAIPGKNVKIMITPVIGTILDLRQEHLNVNTKEVAEVFAVPIETLCDARNQYYTQFKNGYILPVFVAEKYKIWGITAYLTHTFLSSIMPKNIYNNEWTKRKIDLKNTLSSNLETQS